MIAIFPEIVAASAQRDIERLSVLARRYFGGGGTFSPRPDVKALLVNAGVGVETLPLDTPGALVAKDERGRFQIVAIISERRDEGEARFLLAHMLGHVLLDIMPLIARGDWQMSGYRETLSPMSRYVQGGLDQSGSPEQRREDAADRFAAALLMPLGMVRRAQESLKDLERTAQFFGVPTPLLERRLQDIGVLTVRPVNFLDAEKTIGGGARAAAAEAQEARTNLTAPEPSMPRSYAASTYGQTERATRKDGKPTTAAKEAKDTADKKDTKDAKALSRAPERTPTTGKRATKPAPELTQAGEPPVDGRGMDRLRELARRLDTGGKTKR